LCQAEFGVAVRDGDRVIEGRGNEDGDDCDEEKRRVELGGGGFDLLFGETDSSGEETPKYDVNEDTKNGSLRRGRAGMRRQDKSPTIIQPLSA
jgi:hypothetical protein